MSAPSITTDGSFSDMLDDDLNSTVYDLSETTIGTQTSASWHSVASDVRVGHTRSVRSHLINTWLNHCAVEPDIRLTTAQEWRLRTCLRRFLALCDLPLKLSCTQSNESDFIPFIDQVGVDKALPSLVLFLPKKQQSSSVMQPSPINRSWSDQHQRFADRLQQLNLFLRVLPMADATGDLLEVHLSEVDSALTVTPINLTKKPRLLFRILSSMLIFSLRGASSLLELRFPLRDNDGVHGRYHQWNEMANTQAKFSLTVEVDTSFAGQ